MGPTTGLREHNKENGAVRLGAKDYIVSDDSRRVFVVAGKFLVIDVDER